MNPFARPFSLCLALLATAAAAGDKWETKQTGPVTIKVRERPNSRVKEIWAEGDLAASPCQLQLVLTDVKRFADYMPYLVEAHQVGESDKDGAYYVYSKLDMPVLSPRDFIHKTYVDRDCRTDKAGAFANHWFAVPDKLKELDGVVRLKLSEGSWLVTPKGDGHSHVVYKFSVDPGGSVPAFAANMSGTNGIDDTFKAVQREAERRVAEQARADRDAGTGGH